MQLTRIAPPGALLLLALRVEFGPNVALAVLVALVIVWFGWALDRLG